jgi:Major royal jelly protein
MNDLLGTPKKLQNPSVFIVNLNTDKLIRRFEIPANQIKSDSFFVNIVSVEYVRVELNEVTLKGKQV